jgi:hypothetical protein
MDAGLRDCYDIDSRFDILDAGSPILYTRMIGDRMGRRVILRNVT